MDEIYNILGTVSKSTQKIVQTVVKTIPLIHIYRTAYLPG